MAKLINKVRIAKAVKKAKTKFELAHETAQKNAALPIEQGGLGLPPDNTAMDRARAMGFDLSKIGLHGSGSDIKAYDLKKPRAFEGDFYGEGMSTTTIPYDAAHYASYGENPVIYPVMQKGKFKKINESEFITPEKQKQLIDEGYSGVDVSNELGEFERKTFDINAIRSKFAAFDPMKRNSPDLLASVGAGTVAGAGLLATPDDAEASMIGQSAKTFNKAALEYAQQLEKQGAPMEAIRRMTGYQFGTPIHRGVDGKWRQEISDDAARFNTPESLKMMSDAEAQRIKEEYDYLKGLRKEAKAPQLDIFQKEKNAIIKKRQEEAKKAEAELNHYYGLSADPTFTGNFAKYSVPHDELYKAYPDMEAMTVIQPTRNSGYLGAYDDLGTIEVFKASPDKKSTALHEMQHAIQSKEGFARGGNIESFDAEIGDLERSIYNLKNHDEEVKQAQEWIDTSLNKILGMDVSQDEKSRLIKEMHSLVEKNFPQYGHLRTIENKLSGITEYGSLGRTEAAFKQYKRLAGEEEARQTQKRLGLTMKERIDRDPRLDFDTPPEQQIVIGAKGASSPAYLAGVAGVTAAGTALTTKQKAERARLSRMTRKQQLADVTKRALGGLTEIPGDLAKYAHDVANFGAGIFSTADLLGGAAAIPYEMTGNLEAYQRDVQPYVQQANETQSEGFKRLEDMAGKVIETAITATAPAWYPAYQQWSPVIGKAMEDYYYPNADLYDR